MTSFSSQPPLAPLRSWQRSASPRQAVATSLERPLLLLVCEDGLELVGDPRWGWRSSIQRPLWRVRLVLFLDASSGWHPRWGTRRSTSVAFMLRHTTTTDLQKYMYIHISHRSVQSQLQIKNDQAIWHMPSYSLISWVPKTGKNKKIQRWSFSGGPINTFPL